MRVGDKERAAPCDLRYFAIPDQLPAVPEEPVTATRQRARPAHRAASHAGRPLS